ncbi:hypothetical protein AGIG_G25261 [Arapaima gigas]
MKEDQRRLDVRTAACGKLRGPERFRTIPAGTAEKEHGPECVSGDRAAGGLPGAVEQHQNTPPPLPKCLSPVMALQTS